MENPIKYGRLFKIQETLNEDWQIVVSLILVKGFKRGFVTGTSYKIKAKITTTSYGSSVQWKLSGSKGETEMIDYISRNSQGTVVTITVNFGSATDIGTYQCTTWRNRDTEGSAFTIYQVIKSSCKIAPRIYNTHKPAHGWCDSV